MVWQPLNLTEVCPTHTHLTACSSFGYLFLHLVTSLYGGSEDLRIQEKLKLGDFDDKISDKINKYEEEHSRDNDETEEFDFIVVGAGTAGCVVANRLTEVKEWKVLLLEAGPEEPDISLAPGLSETMIGSNVDWNYAAQPNKGACLSNPDGVCGWTRGKMMGGSSSINTMVIVRGNKVDYDGWAAMGNRGWSYEEVLPYFKKSEKNLNIEALNRKYHGVHGPQTASRFPYIDKPSILLTTAFNQIGLPIRDFDGAKQVGTNQAQAFSEDGVRVSTNLAYIRPIRYKRKNLTVRPNSEVTQILIDKHKLAYGVRYIHNGKLRTANVTKDIILSGGTINSPKLLLLSGIGPKMHLEDLNIPVIEDLHVGENLQDHVSFAGLIIAFDNETSTLVDHKQILDEVVEYQNMKEKRGPISSSGPYNSVAFYKTDDNLPAPDIQIQTGNRYKWREYFREPVDHQRVLTLPTVFYDSVMPRVQNLVPKSRGRLLLNATDINGPPVIHNGYLTDPRDLEPLKKGLKILLQIEHTEPFKSGRARFIKVPLEACEHTIWSSDEYVECMARHYTYALSHQVGTCKMGPEWDNTAVVDPRLRVYGISGLRVIDASVIPVVTRGNLNAPTIMVGEKGADLIKQDWLHNYIPDYVHGAYKDFKA
ncbi:GMC oxidoreductase domain-containing protein [Phthorimaea operculella]|nr:GMC oxidoreductase domain-containing protein [Phthorimaea operculella]